MKGNLPHILFLVTDQFRYDVVSPIITPNLYALEQSNGSTTFHRAYTSTPSCTPARAAMLTGKSPWAHGMLGYTMFTNCTKYATTFPRVLRDQLGYRTMAVGKNHFGPIKHIMGYQNETIYDCQAQYFDDYDKWFNDTMPNMDPKATCQLGNNDWRSCPYWYEEYLHPTAWTTREALDSLDKYFGSNETSPLLFKLSYHRPHSPYDPPRRIFEKYLEGGSKSHVPQLNRFVNDSSWDQKYKHHTMEQATWAGDPGEEAARHSRAGYLGNVDFVDENVGKVFDYLRANNLWDDFVIIWTSDHGDQNGDRYLWRKGFPWESNARIRMVMKLPQTSHRLAQQSQAVVENRDIAPTMYDLTGILESVRKQDPLMNGESLVPILTGEQTSVRDWVDLEHAIFYNVTNHWNALIGYDEEGGGGANGCRLWKYVFNAYFASEQLFCLDDDPNETYDLADVEKYNNTLLTWRQRLIEQFEREGRGEEWVRDNVLQPRVKSTVFASNFPCLKKPKLRKGASAIGRNSNKTAVTA